MIGNIELLIDGKKIEVPKGITLDEVSKEVEKNYKYPIILASVDGRIKELSEKVYSNHEVTFIDLTTHQGNRSYVSGLTFLLIFAIKELYGNKSDIIVEHSLDKGLYIKSNFDINSEIIEEIKLKMQEIVKRDMSITKVNVDRLDAIDYFNQVNDFSKVGVMRYNTNTFITLYRLGNLYNYFYNYMPPSTGTLEYFDLNYVDENGFMLRFPTVYINDKIKEYEHHPNMFEVFKECRDWADIMKVSNSIELNNVVTTGNIGDLIRINEAITNSKLLDTAQKIYNKKDVKIVLLAGPSSSGKTTTTRKICLYLKSFGIKPRVISMDDYFVEREENPVDEEGKPDYECLEAIDLRLFDEHMDMLIKGEEVIVPTYNFMHGKKEYKNKVQVEENEIILIEGIHALDPKVLTNIKRDNKYKIYLSALTELNMDNHNRISTSDNRLLRRIIRDNRTRGYDVTHTLTTWTSVRKGEEKYIYPYQDDADTTLNTALIYEIGVLKTYVEPLLYSVKEDSIYYEEAKRLINFLRVFLPIPAESIPQDSVLREFIGGSCFHD